MDLDEAFSIYEQLMDRDHQTDANTNSFCCGGERFYNQELALNTCSLCGSSVPFQRYFDEFLGSQHVKSVYKPIVHFYYKIREICGLVIPESSVDWRHAFEGANIDTARDVRAVLKKHKLTHLNKHTYYFYKQVTGKALISIPQRDHQRMVNLFVKIHQAFRQIKDRERKNLPNYHFIIGYIFDKLGMNLSQHLCKPFMEQSIQKNNEIFDKIEGIIEKQ